MIKAPLCSLLPLEEKEKSPLVSVTFGFQKTAYFWVSSYVGDGESGPDRLLGIWHSCPGRALCGQEGLCWGSDSLADPDQGGGS